MRFFIILFYVSFAKPAEIWDYKKNGDDWGKVNVANNLCGTPENQSPIDLPNSVGSDKSVTQGKEDNF